MERLLALLSKGDNKVKAAAAAALWQLSGESSDDTISETIGLLGGAKAAVSALQANVEEQRENVTGLIQSLAQSPDNAVSPQPPFHDIESVLDNKQILRWIQCVEVLCLSKAQVTQGTVEGKQ